MRNQTLKITQNSKEARLQLREAFERARVEADSRSDKYKLAFELMHGRLPSDGERDMMKRRCLRYENDHHVCNIMHP